MVPSLLWQPATAPVVASKRGAEQVADMPLTLIMVLMSSVLQDLLPERTEYRTGCGLMSPSFQRTHWQ